MSVTITVRSPAELQASINRFSEIIPDAVGQAQYLYARLVMNDAQELVPVDYGYLRATGYVADPWVDVNRISTELGFYAAYAAAVHNIPEPPLTSEGGRSAHHEHGQWHFLLAPLVAHHPEMQKYIVDNVEAMLGGAA